MPTDQNRGVGIDPHNSPVHKKGRSWFFGIGINQYLHFSNLNNAVKDVEDILGMLQTKYDLEPDYTVTLFDEEANRGNIIRTFDHLQRKIRPEDKLIIYYSGHGHLIDTGRQKKGFWVPTDAEKDNTAQYIRNNTVREYIEDIDSLHTLLISDACFSGSLFARGANRSVEAIHEMEQLKSRWAICSGRHNEEVYDGDPGTNSPFANSILKILRTNPLPKLNVMKLIDRAVELTRSNYRQLPEGNPLQNVGHEGGQYIFALKADEEADWTACQKGGSIADYQVFLVKYPDGDYSQKAKNILAELKEEEAWTQAKEGNTIYSYYKYSKNYPQGEYLADAIAAIKKLEEESAWKKAVQWSTISSFVEYKNRYPKGRYLKEADDRISTLLNKSESREKKITHSEKKSQTITGTQKKDDRVSPPKPEPKAKKTQEDKQSSGGIKRRKVKKQPFLDKLAMVWGISLSLASLIGITLGWMVGNPTIGGFIVIISGLLIATGIKRIYKIENWKKIGIILFGWIAGIGIGTVIFVLMQGFLWNFGYSPFERGFVHGLICGGLSGVIGGSYSN